MTEIVDKETGEIVAAERHDLTITEVKANLARVQALLKDVMIGPSKDKPGVHYGVIPGTKKPTLLQPGAELILMMFRLEAFPMVDDLSTPEKVHYRVKVQIKHQTSGITLGWGVGECSSDEDKYRWREKVCKQEFDATDPSARRVKWKHGKNNSAYSVEQVRTNPADIANTILKMALKRALIGGTRGVTAASDVFDQDAEDLSPEVRREIYGEEGGGEPAGERKEPGEIKQPTGTGTEGGEVAQEFSGKLINDGQMKVLRARMTAAGLTDADVAKEFKVSALEMLPFELINKAMAFVASKIK